MTTPTFNFSEPITSGHAIKLFFAHLMGVEMLCLHPDDLFSDYVDIDTRKPYYTPAEARKRQKFLDKAFAFCSKANLEIYQLCIEAKQMVESPFNNLIFKDHLLNQTIYISSEYGYTIEFVNDGRSEKWELEIHTTGISEIDGVDPDLFGETYYYDSKDAAEQDINLANELFDIEFHQL